MKGLKKAVVFAIAVAVILIASSIVFAQEFLGGYSQVIRRFYDPFNRKVFFGQNYTKPYVGFGLKGASSGHGGSAVTYGRRGVREVDAPIAYSSFFRYGRNPGSISMVSAGMRGYEVVDAVVELEPVGFDYVAVNTIPAVPKGTARVLSTLTRKGGATPKGTVILQIANMPPLDAEEVYEAWLYDEESNYSMSIGLLKPQVSSMSRLAFNVDYNLESFDEIMVTKEFYPDLDPRPGKKILSGRIE